MRFNSAAVSCGALLLAVFATGSHCAADTEVFAGRNGGHAFRLTIATGPFRKAVHRATNSVPDPKRLGPSRFATIDGKPEWDRRGKKAWYGTDGGLPSSEIYRLELKVDGRNWHIPRRLYSNCYETNTASPETHLRLLRGGRALKVFMHGSDGAGSYHVTWTFRKSGRHSRRIETSC